MKCSKCGAELMNNAVFCTRCGTHLGNNNYNSQNVNVVSASNSSGGGALVCGILALVFDMLTCLIFPLAIVSFILGIIGLILGIKNKGVSKADTGKILSITALAILVVCIFIGMLLVGAGAVGVEAYMESQRPWYEKMWD